MLSGNVLLCQPGLQDLYQNYFLKSLVCHRLIICYFQESQIKRIFGTMINQKLQDFEEDVKALGDVMTQVIDFGLYFILSLGFHVSNAKITDISNICVSYFSGNYWYLQRYRRQNASNPYQDTLPF